MTLLERPEDLHPTPNILGSKAILGDGVKGSLLSKVESLDLAVVVLDHVQAPGGVAGLDVSRPPLLLAVRILPLHLSATFFMFWLKCMLKVRLCRSAGNAT